MPDPTRVPPDWPVWLEIDLAALAHNVQTLRERAPGAQFMAVVKADAYGHGLLPCAAAAVEAGAEWLGVAQLAEAIALRQNGIGSRVLSWLHAPGADFAGAIAHEVDLAASGVWAIEQIAAAARTAGRPARVHLKVDTGLARNGAYGADWTALLAAARAAEAEGSVQVVGVMMHYANADAPEHPVNLAQEERFWLAVREAEAAGCRLEVRHLANSAATLTRPQAHADLVRPGLAMYGLSPLPQLPGDFGLRPVMAMKARLALVKQVPPGQGVSYGHTWTAAEPTWLGLVPAGYGDGVPRSASNAGPVQVGGRRTSVTGRVCMDQFVVNLGASTEVRAGDEAVLFGGGHAEPTAQQWADAAGTISYEIVTRIGARLPRHLRSVRGERG